MSRVLAVVLGENVTIPLSANTKAANVYVDFRALLLFFQVHTDLTCRKRIFA
jgi:hypothetical protein